MHLLFTDASSIIKSIKKIHAQHVDLTPDNSHVRRYTGRLFSWGNNLQEKIKQFIRFAGKKHGLPPGTIRNKNGRDTRSDKKIGTIRKEAK